LQQAGYSSEYAAALQSYYTQKNAPKAIDKVVNDDGDELVNDADDNVFGGVDLDMAKRQLDGERTYEGKLGELEKWYKHGTINDAELDALLDYIGA
jgi:hypothetical protein